MIPPSLLPGSLPGAAGTTGAEIATVDWATTSLGPVATWPTALRSTLTLMLACPTPMFLAWGPDLLCFYNDAYRPILGYRAETALGRPFKQVWASIWDDIEPLVTATLAGGTRTMTDMPLNLRRDGHDEESWWTFTYSPAFHDDGTIAGLFCVTGETTSHIVARHQRDAAEEQLRASVARHRLRVEIGDALRLFTSPSQIMAFVAERIGPFLGVDRAGYYQVDDDHFIISEEWRTPDSIDMRGRHPMAGFGQGTVDLLREGGTLRFDDTRGVVGAEAYAANGMASVLSVPVHHDGRWAGGLHVFQSVPRAWTDDEEELIRNIGVQAWAAIERVRADEALRNLNRTLHERVRDAVAERDLMWEIAPDLMVVVNDDGTYRAANPAWEQTLGWAPSDLIGMRHFDLVHADDLPLADTALSSASTGRLAPLELRMRHKDGSYRLISWVGTFGGDLVFASGRDVTAEHEVAATLLLYENIVRSNASPIVAFDHDMRILAFNEAHAAKFRQAYGIDQQVGDRLPDQFTDDQRPLVIDLMQRALDGETFSLRAAFGDPEHELLHWDITYNPLRDKAGAVIGAFHHAIDVSAQVRIEEELAASRDALRQAQKMEAVGQLTGGLAHDFNNLLTGMMGNLELLQARIARGRLDDLDRFILAAQGAGRRAASLTQRLLAFSRRQTLDPKPTDVNRLINGMEDMLRRTIGPANTLEVVGAAGLWTANIDAGQLENALLNLCINARDAMPDGGRLTIETANKWLDDRGGRQRDLPPGQYLSICVTDTGTGMSAQTIERAFEPFFTTKPIGQGTGLGLSMIYGFARQSGGQVRIYSEMGMGTTMCIYLPRHVGDAADSDGEEVSGLIENTGSGTVLIVDDEATIRHLVDEVLDDVGYTVIGAGDGAAGIKVLQSGARIDLLITDVGLPNGMNGRQVADAARSLRPGLKVLFITGYAENAAVGNGHLEPGMELLTKPFSLDALVSKVNEMMQSR